jgi:beta-lactamase superfamily II metal-dependent hydrolase
MVGEMRLRIWDVEHGQCAMVQHVIPGGIADHGGKLAMIDSGDTNDWSPSKEIKEVLGRNRLDYLVITNADQDHMSDLHGLSDAGIQIGTLIRNMSYTGATFQAIKAASGPLTDDAKKYAALCTSFNEPTSEPFDSNMGGIKISVYCNRFPNFTDTNNLSLAVFIKYSNFKVLFPGDLEKPGWLALLQQPAFVSELSGTDILVASHHGRENGFCPEVFEHFQPRAVVISDKSIVHETQETVHDYRAVIKGNGLRVRTTGKLRKVLTTRQDGWIQFTVDETSFFIDTENQG